MPRLMPVLTSLFWMALFAAGGLAALRSDPGGAHPAPLAMAAALLSVSLTLGFAWLTASLFLSTDDEVGPAGLTPRQSVYGAALITVAVTAIAASAIHGFNALTHGAIVGSGLIASFQLGEVAVTADAEPVRAALPARRAREIAMLARRSRPASGEEAPT